MQKIRLLDIILLRNRPEERKRHIFDRRPLCVEFLKKIGLSDNQHYYQADFLTIELVTI